MGLRTILRKLLKYPEPSKFLNESYSQEGEDLILNRIYEDKNDGFFVDIGAHHPIRFSNTYKFYKKGWRGINIDATPGSMQPFNVLRPNDINLEIPVSETKGQLSFYMFKEPALNSFSKDHADTLIAAGGYELDKVVDIETDTLQNILDKNLPTGTPIDFMTIDAEGFDLQIVRSSNWNKYRPAMILLESEPDPDYFFESELYKYMYGNNYRFFAKSFKTYFMKDAGADYAYPQITPQTVT